MNQSQTSIKIDAFMDSEKTQKSKKLDWIKQFLEQNEKDSCFWSF